MLSLALRNLLRQPARSMTTIAGVALAVAALFGVQALHRGYDRATRGELDRLGAHVLVVPKGCPYDAASMALHGASWPCYIQIAELKRIRETPGLQVVAPVLMNAVSTAGGGQAVYLGVTTELLQVKRLWHIQGAFPERAGELLVGSEVARQHQLGLGSSLRLPGLDVGGRVVGILAPTAGADDLFIHMPLADAQRVFRRPGQVTHALLRLEDPDRLIEVVNNLKGCGAGMDLNVIPVTHLFRTVQQMLRGTRLLLLSAALVALLAAAAGVGNSILMAIAERTREIGVLRAVGASISQLVTMVCAEALLMSLAGVALGLVLAALVGGGVEAWLRERLPFTPTGRLMVFDPGGALLCLGMASLAGLVAALPAASRAASLPPAAAIRAGEAVR